MIYSTYCHNLVKPLERAAFCASHAIVNDSFRVSYHDDYILHCFDI